MLPGVRESRRLVGDYILNENDNEGQSMTHKENLAMPVLHWMLSKHLSSDLLFLHTPLIFRWKHKEYIYRSASLSTH